MNGKSFMWNIVYFDLLTLFAQFRVCSVALITWGEDKFQIEHSAYTDRFECVCHGLCKHFIHGLHEVYSIQDLCTQLLITLTWISVPALAHTHENEKVIAERYTYRSLYVRVCVRSRWGARCAMQTKTGNPCILPYLYLYTQRMGSICFINYVHYSTDRYKPYVCIFFGGIQQTEAS